MQYGTDLSQVKWFLKVINPSQPALPSLHKRTVILCPVRGILEIESKVVKVVILCVYVSETHYRNSATLELIA